MLSSVSIIHFAIRGSKSMQPTLCTLCYRQPIAGGQNTYCIYHVTLLMHSNTSSFSSTFFQMHY